MKQGSFLSLTHNKPLRCEKFLNEMDEIIPWSKLITPISKHYTEQKTGRKRKELLLMLKIYFLQQWYNLSDPSMEEAIYDRNSFQKFLEIDLLGKETIPDETTILNFRHVLEEHKLQEQLFRIVNKLLEEQGLMMKEGTIVDATIISASSSTKNKDKKRDEEMSSTKKNGKWYFGMKAHIGVDANSGLVHTMESTKAKVHDKKMMDKLFHGKEKAKLGDKAYYDERRKKEARNNEIFWGILDKGKRGKKLSSSQKKKNKKLSSLRAKVEHPFQVIKHLWKHKRVRYKGLSKNTSQFYILFALANLYRVRKQILTNPF
jgi:IS5 family transposase